MGNQRINVAAIARDNNYTYTHDAVAFSLKCFILSDEDYMHQLFFFVSQNSTSLALLGHCCYLSGELDKARNLYERVILYVQLPPKLYIVLLRLADIYMKYKEVCF